MGTDPKSNSKYKNNKAQHTSSKMFVKFTLIPSTLFLCSIILTTKAATVKKSQFLKNAQEAKNFIKLRGRNYQTGCYKTQLCNYEEFAERAENTFGWDVLRIQTGARKYAPLKSTKQAFSKLYTKCRQKRK